MIDRAIVALIAIPLCAQVFDSRSVQGKYHFVQIALSDGVLPEVRTLGGAITFDGRGGYLFSGRLGIGPAAAEPVTGEGAYSVSSAGRLSMESPARPGDVIEVLFGADGVVLVGSAAKSRHGIFVGARAPEGPVNASTIQGNYAGGYLSFRGGEVRGLTSAFVELRLDGRGAVSPATLTGHSAWIDDINRTENPSAVAYSVRDDGAGTLRFADRSDFAAGEREFMAAAGGDLLLGYGTGASDRDILVVVRKAAEASTLSLRGQYWLADLCAVNSFSFQPEKPRINSGLGTAGMDGGGNATLSEDVWTGNRHVNLATAGIYRIYADGSGLFGARPDFGLKNFAIGNGGQIFVGVQVGPPGKLSLDHGIIVGMRAPAADESGVFLSPYGVLNSGSLTPQLARIAPGTVISLFGSGLAPGTAAAPLPTIPRELGGVQVTINGSAVPILMASNRQINVIVPFELSPAKASIQVDNNGRLSNAVPATIGSTSPAVYTANGPGTAPLVFHADATPVSNDNPARPGETIVVYANGLGPVEPAVAAEEPAPGTPPSRASDLGIEVLFDGQPGNLSFAGLAPGLVGVYQLNVVVPGNTPRSGRISLAIGTSDAFTDIVEIPIARP